jgi:hypothetical protein
MSHLRIDLKSGDQVALDASSELVALYVSEFGQAGADGAVLTPAEAVELGTELIRLGKEART